MIILDCLLIICSYISDPDIAEKIIQVIRFNKYIMSYSLRHKFFQNVKFSSILSNDPICLYLSYFDTYSPIFPYFVPSLQINYKYVYIIYFNNIIDTYIDLNKLPNIKKLYLYENNYKFRYKKGLEYINDRTLSDLSMLTTETYKIRSSKDVKLYPNITRSLYSKTDIRMRQNIDIIHVTHCNDVYNLSHRCENLYIYYTQGLIGGTQLEAHIIIHNKYPIKNLYLAENSNWYADNEEFDDYTIKLDNPVENFYLESVQILLHNIRFNIEPKVRKMKLFVKNTFHFYEK